MTKLLFILLTLAAFGYFGYTISRIVKFFKLTKKGNRFDNIGERINNTLLVAFGQSKMLKRPLAGILHAFIFWGFLVLAIGTVEMMLDGIIGAERCLSRLGIFYDIVIASGELLAFIIIFSLIIFLSRRLFLPPKRFIAREMTKHARTDAVFVLSLIMILMISLLGMNTAYLVSHPQEHAGMFPVSHFLVNLFSSSSPESLHIIEQTCWWIHILVIYLFLNLLPLSKHFHVITAIPNVFFSRLEPYSKLTNMESVTREVKLMLDPNATVTEAPAIPERFGVKDVEDVTWKTLLDSYTCTQCGRCTAVCPANITGKMLSPRKLFIDLRKRMNDKGDGLVAKGKEFTDNKFLVGDYITEEEIWACTTCMACIEECPVDIDHVPFIVDMRRSLVMEESKMPAGIASMNTNIENNGAPWQFSPSDRLNWAEGLELKS